MSVRNRIDPESLPLYILTMQEGTGKRSTVWYYRFCRDESKDASTWSTDISICNVGSRTDALNAYLKEHRKGSGPLQVWRLKMSGAMSMEDLGPLLKKQLIKQMDLTELELSVLQLKSA